MIHTMVYGKTLPRTLQSGSLGESIINKHKLWDTYDLGSVALVFLEENKQEEPPVQEVSEDLQVILKLLLQFNQFSTEKKEMHNSFTLYKQYLGRTVENYMASLYQSGDPAYARLVKLKEEIETLKHEQGAAKSGTGRQHRQKNYKMKQRQDEISKRLIEEIRRSEKLTEVLSENGIQRKGQKKPKPGAQGALIKLGAPIRPYDIRPYDVRPIGRNTVFYTQFQKSQMERDRLVETKLEQSRTEQSVILKIRTEAIENFTRLGHIQRRNSVRTLKTTTELIKKSPRLGQIQRRDSVRALKTTTELIKKSPRLGQIQRHNSLRSSEINHITQESLRRFADRIEHWVANRTVDRIIGQMQESVANRLAEQTTIKITGQRIEGLAFRIADRTTDRLTEYLTNKFTEKITENAARRLAERPMPEKTVINRLAEQTTMKITGQRIEGLTFRIADRRTDRLTEYLNNKFTEKITENAARRIAGGPRLQKSGNLIQSHQITKEKLSLWMENVNLKAYKELRQDISRLERNRLVTLLTKATKKEKINLVEAFSKAGIPKREGLTLKKENPEAAIRKVIVKSSEETYETVKKLLTSTVYSLEKEYAAFEKKSRQLEESSISIFLKKSESKAYQKQLLEVAPGQESKVLKTIFEEIERNRSEKLIFTNLGERAGRLGQKYAAKQAVGVHYLPKAKDITIKKNFGPKIGEGLKLTHIPLESEGGKKNFMTQCEYRVDRNVGTRMMIEQIRRENAGKHNLLSSTTVEETYRKRSEEEKKILLKRELSEHVTLHKEEKDTYQRAALNSQVFNRIVNVELRKTRGELSPEKVFENQLFLVRSFHENFTKERQLKYNLEENQAAAIEKATSRALTRGQSEARIIQRERSQDVREMKFAKKEKNRESEELERQKRLVTELSNQVREQGEQLQTLSQRRETPGKQVSEKVKVKSLEAQEKASKEFVRMVKKEVMDTLEKEMRLERQRRGL